MKEIVDTIKRMNFEELKELQKDIENNNEIIKKVMWQRLQELSNSEKFCATCFKELRNPRFTLIIGEKYRRKLSFCASDCFKYFMRNLEEMKEEFCKTTE